MQVRKHSNDSRQNLAAGLNGPGSTPDARFLPATASGSTKSTTANMQKLIEIRNTTPRQSIWMKRNNVTPENGQGVYNADVLPGHSLRIFGTMTNHGRGPQEFDTVFRLGDVAEYGSYNMIYTGKIVRIGAKTVTIKHCEHSAEVTQLDIYSFIDKNWNFDAVKIAKHNSEESQCL